MVGIYKITTPTSKVYIGQSTDIDFRFSDYRRMRCNRQTKLFNSFKKHGVENHVFETVHELPVDIDTETMVKYEQLYMDLYRDCGVELVNLRDAGSRGKHSEESKQRMREANKGQIPWIQGGTHSVETRAKLSAILKGKNVGRRHTDEAKRKIGAAGIGRHTGKKRTPEQCERIKAARRLQKPPSKETVAKRANAIRGKLRPQHVIEALRKANTGKKLLPEAIKKRTETRKNNNNGKY